MKKLFAVSILFIFLSAAAFAQFKVGITAVYQGDILRTDTGLGDYDTYDGATHFLTTHDYWINSKFRWSLEYTDPDGNYGGLLEIKGDGLFTKLTTPANVGFGDWNVWGKAGILKAFMGNTDEHGATVDGRFAHYNDYMDNFKFEPLGIMRLGDLNGFLLPKKDVNVSNLKWGDGSYGFIEADFTTIKVAVAGELAVPNTIVTTVTPPTTTTTTLGQIGAGFRVSGNLDVVKFDVIYKMFGVTPDASGDDYGNVENAYGLFANFGLVENTLGLTVGYSGNFLIQGDTKVGNTTIENSNPWYHGIDLRAQYTGVPDLTVSLNNNISLSSIEGADGTKKNVTGLRGNTLAKDISEGYFGMYNALLVDYKLSDSFLLSFQIGNRWYHYTETDKASIPNDEIKTTIDVDGLQIVAAASYSPTKYVTFGTGLAFNIVYGTTKYETPNATVKGKGGILTFGIPLTVKVAF